MAVVSIVSSVCDGRERINKGTESKDLSLSLNVAGLGPEVGVLAIIPVVFVEGAGG